MKVTVKGFLHYHKSEWDEFPRYQIFSSDMSCIGPEYVPIKEVEIDMEIPDDFDPIPKQVEALRAKKKEVMAESQQKLNDLEHQIQAFLCIEFKPEVSA